MKVAVVMPHPVGESNSGDRARTSALRTELKRAGHEAVVVSPDWTLEAGKVSVESDEVLVGQATRGAAKVRWRARLAMGRLVNPYSLHTPKVADSLKGVLRDLGPDVVDYQHSYMPLLRGPWAQVLTIHNVHANPQFRPELSRLQRWSSASREYRSAAGADRVVVFSDQERDRLNPGLSPKTDVVPIGHPLEQVASIEARRHMREALFVGSMDYAPNLNAAVYLLERWQDLQRATSLKRLTIVGRSASLLLQRVHSRLPEGVEVKTDVPDLSFYYRRADVTLMPIRDGGGTRLKAIEAMAYGLPIVATSLAVEGLNVVDAESYCQAEDADELKRQLTWLEDIEARRAIGIASRRQWEAAHSPEGMCAAMLEVYRSALSDRSASGRLDRP